MLNESSSNTNQISQEREKRKQQLLADGGNGLEEALQRHFWDDLTCILDWYHASEHLHDSRCRSRSNHRAR